MRPTSTSTRRINGPTARDWHDRSSQTRIRFLTNLESLDLEGTPITDAGLAHLEGLTKLAYLDLSGFQVTDVGLVHLKGLTNLNLGYTRNTRVTDGGVKNLQRTLPNLKIYVKSLTSKFRHYQRLSTRNFGEVVSA